MGKKITITESQLKKVIDSVISEQWGQGPFSTHPGPGKLTKYSVQKTVTMDGSLFKNGIDQIDLNSGEFQKAINSIQSALSKTKDLTITVQGGASAVGAKYDNKSLAKRRAVNFIKTVQPKFKDVKFVEGNHVVGKSTVKDSPEANLEQFVKLFFNTTEERQSIGQAVDHTTTKMNIDPRVMQKLIADGKTIVKCIAFPEKHLNSYNIIMDKMSQFGFKEVKEIK
jgi:hypothetical protein